MNLNNLFEAANPAQQAAIAISMKKAGKKPKSEDVAEGSMNEFALAGSSDGDSGRWYTDDELADIIGDDWFEDFDVSNDGFNIDTHGEKAKQNLASYANSWFDDKGYNVNVLGVDHNDVDHDLKWYIVGSFQNDNFADKDVDEGKGPLGQGDLSLALKSLAGGWSGWHKEEDMSSDDVDVYDYDDGEGNYYGRGTIEHNLKTGEIKVEYHDSESDVDVDDTFHSVGDAMKALRGQWGQSHGGKAPNFDRLGQRKQHGPDDLRKTDRTGRKGTLAGGPSNELKRSIQWSKGKHGPQGVLPEQGVTEGSQRVDSLVTDALKIMKGSEASDAVAALKTVLGDREYNGRRGYYNFYVRQMLDMLGQQGIAEAGYRNYDDNRTGFSKNSQAYRADGGANDENHELDRRREQQEKSGTWYIRLNGKLIKDKQGNPYSFRGKAAANKAAVTMQAKLFNQGKEFVLTTNPNDKPQGVAEGQQSGYGRGYASYKSSK